MRQTPRQEAPHGKDAIRIHINHRPLRRRRRPANGARRKDPNAATSSQSTSAPSSPAPTAGAISNPSAAPKSSGSRPPANSPTVYPEPPEEDRAPCRQTGRGLCVLAVKKSQLQLWEDIAAAFEYGERTRFAGIEHDVFETVNKARGRVERRRRLGAVRPPSAVGHANDRGEWANMNSAAMIESARRADGEISVSQAALHNESAGSRGPDSGAARERRDLEYLRAILRLAQ